MSGRFRSALRFLIRSVLKTGLFVLAITAACILYGNLAGIPQPVLRYFLAGMNQGGSAVVVESAELSFPTGVNLRGVSVYSKHADI